jgi:hypothetical protein
LVQESAGENFAERVCGEVQQKLTGQQRAKVAS